MESCKILIVEDESIVAMDMAEMLTKVGYRVLPGAMGFREAVELLEEERPDLVLVDINLSGDKTGLDLAKELQNTYHLPFIFITSHSDRKTIQEASATLPGAYLLKPFDADDLFASIEIAMANHAEKNKERKNSPPDIRVEDSIFVKTDRNFVKIKIEDILWLEAEHNYLYIITEKTKHIVRSNFRDFLASIHNDRFVQIHKSYIINISKVHSFSHTDVVIHEKDLPLSRNFKDEFFEKMNRMA